MMRRCAVDPYVTRLDARCETMRTIEVVRPDRARQADVERIDAIEHVVFVRPAQDADDRPEDLFARDAHVVGDVGENRRLDEETLRELWIRRPLAAVRE